MIGEFGSDGSLLLVGLQSFIEASLKMSFDSLSCGKFRVARGELLRQLSLSFRRESATEKSRTEFSPKLIVRKISERSNGSRCGDSILYQASGAKRVGTFSTKTVRGRSQL